jgi:hypothetical protein
MVKTKEFVEDLRGDSEDARKLCGSRIFEVFVVQMRTMAEINFIFSILAIPTR